METTGRTVNHSNEVFTMSSEAWWLDNAIETNGKLLVARLQAKQGSLSFMLDFTVEELANNNIMPGTFESAYNDKYAPCNQPKQGVVTQRQFRDHISNLQNEGCTEEEESDNSPYMKGDDMDI